MKKALRLLGYESGEQAVAALGFVGAMKAVISTTDGSTTSIAKLFPRVRGLNGVLRLTGTGADAFERSLAELEMTDLTELNDQFQAITETDVEKVTKDLNKLKNFFTVELGTALVRTTYRGAACRADPRSDRAMDGSRGWIVMSRVQGLAGSSLPKARAP